MISSIFIDGKGDSRTVKRAGEEIACSFDLRDYLSSRSASILSTDFTCTDEMECEDSGNDSGVIYFLAKGGEIGVDGSISCTVTTAGDYPEKIILRLYFDIIN